MPNSKIVDTDVAIDYLRGQPDAVQLIRALSERPIISLITVAELYAGVREGVERAELEAFLTAVEVAPIDEDTAQAAGLFKRDYGRSHGVGLADAVIAATADKWGATLITLNAKHFPMLSKIHVPYTKP